MGLLLELQLRDYDRAIFNYEEFIRLSTDHVSIYEVQKRIAGIYFDDLKNAEKSIAAYKKLIELSPDSLEQDLFQFRIGLNNFRMNNFPQARAEYQKLLDRFPKSQFASKARFEIGKSYYMEGNYETAIEAFKYSVRNDPNTAISDEARYYLAQCLEQLEKFSEAEVLYQSLLNSYPQPEVIKIRLEAVKKRIAKQRKQ